LRGEFLHAVAFVFRQSNGLPARQYVRPFLSQHGPQVFALGIVVKLPEGVICTDRRHLGTRHLRITRPQPTPKWLFWVLGYAGKTHIEHKRPGLTKPDHSQKAEK